MSLRDRILAADDHRIEIVDVPEWDTKVGVKSMTLAEQQRFLKAVRKKGVDQFAVDQDKFAPQLLITTVVDPDTQEKVFEYADAEALARKSSAAISRIVEVATRLAGLGDRAQIDEAKAELKGIASNDSV